MVAFALANSYTEKFGGDQIDDLRASVDAYAERIGWRRDR
jgi:chorismate synthase